MDNYKNPLGEALNVKPELDIQRRKFRIIVLAVVIFAVVDFAIFAVVFYKLFSRPFDTIDKITNIRMDVTNTFISHVEKQQKTADLVLCKVTRNETSRKEYEFSNPFVMDGKVLSKAVIEARAPVTFNYFVDMKGKWLVNIENDTVVVTAPKIQCLEPAIDTAKLETRIEGGWLITKEKQKLDELVKQFYPDMVKKGMSREYLDSVREQARVSLAEFVDAWIAKELIQKHKVRNLKIKFEDEEKFPAVSYSANLL